ncbi:MAG: fused MFS/spermidine synthase [Synergistaceae bacterium]|nr:fused MFS/spermidine synthase [Synergistaceae bacterium]
MKLYKSKKKVAVEGAVGETTTISLYAASFLCGMCVMVLEMAGSRVVAPYMGTSLVVWTSLIGVIMLSLTVGYWMGGVVSDRYPRAALLAWIVGAAALVTAFVALVANPLLNALSRGASNIYLGSVIAAICLFSVPSALLGMVSPFVVRLAINNLGKAGATVGRFSALSSAGSILGTFLGGFVLISLFSSRTILFIVAAVLAAVAFVLNYGGKASKTIPPLMLAILSISLGILNEAGVLPMTPVGLNIDTQYNAVRIMDMNAFGSGRKIRILQTDPMGAQSLMYIDSPSELYSDYTKFYDLAFHYKPDARRALMLGGGGYCVPKHITATRPEVSVDVVEMDPGITAIAREYFHLADRPGQTIYHEDARSFLNREAVSGKGKYDAIFEDVFGSSYNIPFHLTTAECMSKVRDLLAPDGVFIVNIISSIDHNLFSGIYSSIAASFPYVMIFPATYPNDESRRQNIMVVALASEPSHEPEPESAYMEKLLAHRWTRPFSAKIAAFTDAFAPVEKYTVGL